MTERAVTTEPRALALSIARGIGAGRFLPVYRCGQCGGAGCAYCHATGEHRGRP